MFLQKFWKSAEPKFATTVILQNLQSPKHLEITRRVFVINIHMFAFKFRCWI